MLDCCCGSSIVLAIFVSTRVLLEEFTERQRKKVSVKDQRRIVVKDQRGRPGSPYYGIHALENRGFKGQNRNS